MKTKLTALVAGMLVAGSAMSFGAAAQQLTPANNSTFTLRRPAFTWTAASGALWHWVWIQKDNNYYHDAWVQGTIWTPSWDLPPGHYQWWVGSWVGSSYGPWSSESVCNRTEPSIVSSVNGVANDGGNIALVGAGGVSITPDAAAKRITIGVANGAVTAAQIAPDFVGSLAGVATHGGNVALVGGPSVTVTADNGAKKITIGVVATPEDMVRVPGGMFSMGYAGVASPVHQVALSSFYLDKFEVTYGLWYAVRQWALANGYSFQNAGREGIGTDGAAPTWAQGEPVTMVSWRDAIVWCNARSQQEGLTPVYTYGGAVIRDSRHANAAACDGAVFNPAAKGYRLPTEAEWEYAARYVRGSTELPGDLASGAYSDHTVAAACDAVAWYQVNSSSRTHFVGTKKANQLGVFDMSGNVWELCWDWYADYTSAAATNPTGPGTGMWRVLRGGSWLYSAYCLQCAYRERGLPSGTGDSVGFRCARGL